jgi:hypothetical protein
VLDVLGWSGGLSWSLLEDIMGVAPLRYEAGRVVVDKMRKGSKKIR